MDARALDTDAKGSHTGTPNVAYRISMHMPLVDHAELRQLRAMCSVGEGRDQHMHLGGFRGKETAKLAQRLKRRDRTPCELGWLLMIAPWMSHNNGVLARRANRYLMPSSSGRQSHHQSICHPQRVSLVVKSDERLMRTERDAE